MSSARYKLGKHFCFICCKYLNAWSPGFGVCIKWCECTLHCGVPKECFTFLLFLFLRGGQAKTVYIYKMNSLVWNRCLRFWPLFPFSSAENSHVCRIWTWRMQTTVHVTMDKYSLLHPGWADQNRHQIVLLFLEWGLRLMILTFIQVMCTLPLCHVFAGLLWKLAVMCGCGVGWKPSGLIWFSQVS